MILLGLTLTIGLRYSKIVLATQSQPVCYAARPTCVLCSMERRPNRPPPKSEYTQTPLEGGVGSQPLNIEQTPQSSGGMSPELDLPREAPPAHEGLESTPVQPSPGEQKGFDRARLIAAIEKRFQRLIQPDIGTTEEDVKLAERRVLQGLHDLEEGRLLGADRHGGIGRKANFKAKEALERSYIELTGQEPDNRIIDERLNGSYVDGYINRIEDLLTFIGRSRPAERENEP